LFDVQELRCFYLLEILIRLQPSNMAMTILSLRSAGRRNLQCEFFSDLRGAIFRCVVFILYCPSSHQTDVHSALGAFKRQADLPKTVLNSPKLNQTCGPGSSVGIATGYGLDGPEIESRWGRDFLHLSKPALGPTQPLVQ
jgi:hypothetical protein